MIEVDVRGRVGILDLDAKFESDAHVTALFGRSGAGKSTLVNMIAGLTRPERGRIAIDGRVLFDSRSGVDVPVHERRIGYVFQEGRLFPHLTVKHNLLYGRSRASADESAAAVERIVALLGLERLLARRPGDLSGGEKQRVAIGRALLASPRVLLMDEPLAALDAQRKREILDYIERLRTEMRLPIVYVSHAVDEVLRVADAVVLLDSGKVAASGPVEDVMGRPDLGAAGEIFQGGAVIDSRVVAIDPDYALTSLEFAGGTLNVTGARVRVGEAVRVRIRARDVSLALEKPAAISVQNILPARVTDLSAARDGVVRVGLEIGPTPLRARVTQRAAEQLGLVPGKPVYALIKAVSLDRHGVFHAP
jgi:molybdate transport system ATP-binding protein